MLTESLEWFALRVRPRTERVVAQALASKGYEDFLPLHTERRRWSDRVKVVEVPLFAGYVFCRFDVQARLPILTIPGVIQVVSVAKVPQPIPDEEMASLRAVVASGLEVQAWPYLHIDKPVRVIAGPLAGASGTLVSVKSRDRLVVSVSLLQRSVSVEVPEPSVWPVDAAYHCVGA